MDTFTTLKQMGLTQKEVMVYLASLELGSASISNIAKRARLKRPTVYLVMNELIKKNFIAKIPKGKRIFYHAENPEKIIADAKNMLIRLEDIIPNLISLYQNPPQKTKVRFYEGREEIKKIFWEAATFGKEFICCFSFKNYMHLVTKKGNKKIYTFLEKKKVKINDIIEDSIESREYARYKLKRKLGQTKFLPKNFKLKTDCFVWGNKVALISYLSQSAIIIEDRDIVETQRNFLKFMWKNL